MSEVPPKPCDVQSDCVERVSCRLQLEMGTSSFSGDGGFAQHLERRGTALSGKNARVRSQLDFARAGDVSGLPAWSVGDGDVVC